MLNANIECIGQKHKDVVVTIEMSFLQTTATVSGEEYVLDLKEI